MRGLQFIFWKELSKVVVSFAPFISDGEVSPVLSVGAWTSRGVKVGDQTLKARKVVVVGGVHASSSS